MTKGHQNDMSKYNDEVELCVQNIDTNLNLL